MRYVFRPRASAVRWWLVALSLAGVQVVHAQAVGPYGPQNVFDYLNQSKSGNTTRLGYNPNGGTPIPVSPYQSSGANYSGWQQVNNFNAYNYNGANGGVGIAGKATVSIGPNGQTVPVNMMARVPPASALAGFGLVLKTAAKVGLPIVSGVLAAKDIADFIQASGIQRNPDASDVDRPFLKQSAPSSAYRYRSGTYEPTRFSSAGDACGAFISRLERVDPGKNWYLTSMDDQSASGSLRCYASGSGGGADERFIVDAVPPGPATYAPSDWGGIIDQINADNLKSNTLSEMYNQARQLAKHNNGVNPFAIDIPSSNITTSGPSSLPETVDKTTTTKTGTSPDGRPQTTTTTTTTRTENPLTYDGDKVTVKPTTTTTTTTTTKTTNPDGTTSEKTDTSTEKTVQEEKESGTKETDTDLCKLHPEIIACQKFGDAPEPEKLAKKTYNYDLKELPFAQGVCPQPVTFTAFAVQHSLSYQPACDVFAMLKPLVLLGATVIAAWIVVDGFRV